LLWHLSAALWQRVARNEEIMSGVNRFVEVLYE